MSVQAAAATSYTYRANEHQTLLSEVNIIHCVLMPRALLIAGYDGDGQLVMARYNSYIIAEPAWNPAFFEQEFMTEKLLGVPQQVKAIFIGSNAELIIPNALYEERAARLWMERMQAICSDDVLYGYHVKSAGAQYTFSLPAKMDKLLHRYFGQTRIIPVAAYQFYKPAINTKYLLQCLITQDTVIATLHQQGNLFWHRQFAYQTVEDIAWQVANLCLELQIPRIDLRVECTMLCPDCYELGPELERFFPKISWATNDVADEEAWAPVVFLAQQLYACAL